MAEIDLSCTDSTQPTHGCRRQFPFKDYPGLCARCLHLSQLTSPEQIKQDAVCTTVSCDCAFELILFLTRRHHSALAVEVYLLTLHQTRSVEFVNEKVCHFFVCVLRISESILISCKLGGTCCIFFISRYPGNEICSQKGCSRCSCTAH